MAEPFTRSEWRRIRAVLRESPDRFGLPRREYGSVLAGSFNIRKLGNPDRRAPETWDFLADVCRRFDLLAVQEVMDDLRGITRLKSLMGADFDMAVSDTTGAFPGERGLTERLAFIYNRNVCRRGEVASDISYDRSKLLKTQLAHRALIEEAMREYLDKLSAFERGDRRTRPAFSSPAFFLSFIRSPYLVAFEVTGHPSSRTYRLMAINAHLLFGKSMRERRLEFDALMDWIIARVKEDSAYYKNFVLLGDLNLKFDDPERDRASISRHLKTFDNAAGDEVKVLFPFLDPHPSRSEVFRTNARLSETFDQIGLFYRPTDLPRHLQDTHLGDDVRLGPDYGMFNFVQLFSEALRGKPFDPDARSRSVRREQREFLARFEHEVSDHMPIWFRIPLFEAPLMSPEPR